TRNHKRTWGRADRAGMCWLLVLALGGIIGMSLNPSKAVQRVFPGVPVVCLPVCAQLDYFKQRKHSQLLLRRAVITVIVVSAVYAGGYAATRVIQGYRTHRDVLVKFGKEVRRIAQTSHFRYEVVRAPDEGLLLYLERTRFLTSDRAAQLWRAGTIDGVVVRAGDQLQLAELPEVELRPRLSATKDNKSGTTYV